MIDNIFEYPSYIEISLMKEHSYYMNKYLNEDIINSLRKLYLNDQEIFTIILEELYLRGFSFKKEYQNILFKENHHKNEEYIFVNKDRSNYKNINFESIGMGQFVQRFKIETDMFFNGIPTDCFVDYCVKKSMREYITDNLIHNGFNIRNINKSYQTIDKENNKFDQNNVIYYFQDRGLNYHDILNRYFSEENFKSNMPENYAFKLFNNIYSEEGLNVHNNITNDITEFKTLIEQLEIEKVQLSSIFSFYYNDLFSHINFKAIDINDDFKHAVIAKKLNEKLKDKNNSLYGPKKLIKYLETHLSEEKIDILMRRALGEKLESIGKIYGKTRERIRQIEKKSKEKYLFDKNLDIIEIILLNEMKNNIIEINELHKIFGTNEKFNLIFAELLGQSKKLIIYKDRFIISTKIYDNVNSILEKLLNKPVILINELEKFDKKYQKIICTSLLDKGYRLNDDRYINKKLTQKDMLEFIYKEVIKKPIIHNEENYELIKKHLYRYFREVANNSSRTLFSTALRSDKIVLVGKNTYMYDDFNRLPDDFLGEVNQFISDYLKDNIQVFPAFIYESKLDLMEENNIMSYQHLYAMINYFFSDDYEVGKGNTLMITNKNVKVGTNVDILEIKFESNNALKFNQLLNELHWPRYKLEQTIAHSKFLIISDDRAVISLKGIEEEETYPQLLSLISACLEKHYAYTFKIIDALLENNFFDLLQKYNILSIEGLSNFIKLKFEDIKGVSQFLYRINRNISSITDVILLEFDEIFERNQFNKFFENIGYSTQKLYSVYLELLTRNLIIPYEDGMILNNTKFNISQEILEEYDLFLAKKFEDKWYLTANDLKDFIYDHRYDLTYELNNSILISMALTLNYKCIDAYGNSKYNLPIILNEQSNIQDYATLIKKEYDENYDGYNEAIPFLNYLKRKELAMQGANSIYESIMESEYFEFDNFGFFKVR